MCPMSDGHLMAHREAPRSGLGHRGPRRSPEAPCSRTPPFSSAPSGGHPAGPPWTSPPGIVWRSGPGGPASVTAGPRANRFRAPRLGAGWGSASVCTPAEMWRAGPCRAAVGACLVEWPRPTSSVGRPSWPPSTALLARTAGGEPTTLLITGDAGVGKTRLVDELRDPGPRRRFPGAHRGLSGAGRGWGSRWLPSPKPSDGCAIARPPRFDELVGGVASELQFLISDPAVDPEPVSSRPSPGRLLELLLALVEQMGAAPPDGDRGRGSALGRSLDARPALVPGPQPGRPCSLVGTVRTDATAPTSSAAPVPGRLSDRGPPAWPWSPSRGPAGPPGRGHHRQTHPLRRAGRPGSTLRGQPLLRRGAAGRGRRASGQLSESLRDILLQFAIANLGTTTGPCRCAWPPPSGCGSTTSSSASWPGWTTTRSTTGSGSWSMPTCCSPSPTATASATPCCRRPSTTSCCPASAAVSTPGSPRH